MLGSSVHGIFQARILEWVAISYSRESSQPGIKSMFPGSPALAGGFFTTEPPGKPLSSSMKPQIMISHLPHQNSREGLVFFLSNIGFSGDSEV